MAWGVKSFDAYPKLHSDMQVRTLGGAAVSVVAALAIVLLFLSELSAFLAVDTIDHLVVDKQRGEKMKINFDITFSHIPCELISVDAMDVAGNAQVNVNHHISKLALDSKGNEIGRQSETKAERGQSLGHDKLDASALTHADSTPEKDGKEDPTKKEDYCGSCYGAERHDGDCCKTCEDVTRRYQMLGWSTDHLDTVEQCKGSGEARLRLMQRVKDKEGCRFAGYLEVNKVQGQFHFSPGSGFQAAHVHMHDMEAFENGLFNVSHTVNHLSFGDTFPGMENPLDGAERSLGEDGAGLIIYYTKVVPTTYQYLNGEETRSNQFSATENTRVLTPAQIIMNQGMPGVFIFYEISPIMVQFREVRSSLGHFLTQLCAIVGGVFTVAGIIDRVVYGAMKSLEKKMEIGKLG